MTVINFHLRPLSIEGDVIMILLHLTQKIDVFGNIIPFLTGFTDSVHRLLVFQGNKRLAEECHLHFNSYDESSEIHLL